MSQPPLPPISLYIHLPWCERKCPYCDFNSHQATTPPFARYIETLWQDLQRSLAWVQGRTPVSVFIGGGTPSLMPGADFARLISGLRRLWPWDDDCEITLEANPGSSDADNFAAYREAGVQRLSLGIQSFDDQHLTALGRVHDAKQACFAIETALALFPRVNVDLMYGLPQQNLKQAISDVHQAISFGLTHLSCYQLTLEPGTPFHRQPPSLPSMDLCADMQLGIEEQLSQANLKQYEISAYAADGQQCRHNLNYWQFGDYLGIGAGAHSKLTRLGADGAFDIVRASRASRPETYLRDCTPKEWRITMGERPMEFMINALRLNQGVAADFFAARTGLAVDCIAATLKTARQQGLMIHDPQQLCATDTGRRYLNDLLLRFAPIVPATGTPKRQITTLRTVHP